MIEKYAEVANNNPRGLTYAEMSAYCSSNRNGAPRDVYYYDDWNAWANAAGLSALERFRGNLFNSINENLFGVTTVGNQRADREGNFHIYISREGWRLNNQYSQEQGDNYIIEKSTHEGRHVIGSVGESAGGHPPHQPYSSDWRAQSAWDAWLAMREAQRREWKGLAPFSSAEEVREWLYPNGNIQERKRDWTYSPNEEIQPADPHLARLTTPDGQVISAVLNEAGEPGLISQYFRDGTLVFRQKSDTEENSSHEEINIFGSLGPNPEKWVINYDNSVRYTHEDKDFQFEDIYDVSVNHIEEFSNRSAPVVSMDLKLGIEFAQGAPSDGSANIDPLVIDMDGDGIDLLSVSDSEVFLQASNAAFAMRAGWAAPNEAILIRDSNANGKVETSEIIGFTSGNAWADLAAMAGDLTFNASDEAWAEIRLWRDIDEDGSYEAEELMTMQQSGILKISLSWTPATDVVNGNRIYGQTTLEMSDGTERDVYSVYFAADPTDTHFIGKLNLYDWINVAGLADMRGSGSVADLRISAALRPELRAPIHDIVWGSDSNRDAADQIISGALRHTEDLILKWMDADGIMATSRGEFADARQLTAMERYTASPFVQVGGLVNPTVTAGSSLDVAWAEFVKDVAIRLLVQGRIADALGDTHYDLKYDRIVSTHSVADAIDAFIVMGADLVSISDRLSFWSGALAVLDALQAVSTNPAPNYAASVEAALTASGLGGWAHVLRTPVFLADGLYFHRASGDTFILGSEAGNVMSVNAGDHIVLGGAGDDLFRPGEGKNLIDLGGGRNRVVYDLVNGGMTIDLDAGIATRVSGRTDSIRNVQDVVGTLGDDLIRGDAAGNLLIGNQGMDTVIGGAGNDTIYLYDSTQPHLISFGASRGIGQAGDDWIAGNEGANLLDGGLGNDTLHGNGQHDTLLGGAGDDVLNGAGGDDTADYITSTSGIIVDGTDIRSTEVGNGFTVTNDGEGGADILVGIERLRGSVHADLIQGGASSILMRGWDGQDTLRGGSGHETLLGDDGDDHLAGGEGNDWLEGGAGLDTADFSAATSGVNVNLGQQRAWADGQGGTDVLIGIERVLGSAHGDRIAATVTTDEIRGGGGNDTIFLYDDVAWWAVMTGPVRADGEAGDDWIAGNEGANSMSGGTGADTLYGNGGDDVLAGGTGDDLVDGGWGRDEADYRGAAAGIVADLRPQVWTSNGWAGLAQDGSGGTDRLVSIEVVHGSQHGDHVTAHDSAMALNGHGGNDTLVGGAGADYLEGGDGDDVLDVMGGTWNMAVGGAGNDVYVVRDGACIVVEQAGQGHDRVEAWRDWTIDANIEALFLKGSAVNAFGGVAGDLLVGNAIGNGLYGNAGNDTLDGGAGADWLQGGAGSDVFRIASLADAGDIIADFEVANDRIELSSAGFGGILPVGNLADAAAAPNDEVRFVANATGAATANGWQFIKDTATRKLWFDADGTGSQQATLVAEFTNSVTLEAHMIAIAA
ncbi:MAG: hypothetical protein K2X49_19760 [Acetobacteraceae bacterium]|nr:hypothetical protein [Acetobacteraceae bacterium]